MRNFWQLILGVLIFLIFNACGGGGGGGNGGSSNTQTIKGTVYDDVIVGLGYETRDYITKKTDSNGHFDHSGGEVKFYLGSLYIGKISQMPSDRKVFLSDMLGLSRGDYRSNKLVKLARLLQALDTIPNDGKITLDQAQIRRLFSTNQDIASLDITTLGLQLPTPARAKQRVKNTLTSQNIPLIGNIPPIANAGADQTLQAGNSVTLDGSSSTDPDGTIVSYQWFEGTNPLGTSPNQPLTTLGVGTHTITLKVTDNDGDVQTDQVTITITPSNTPNQPPIANAGPDQTAPERDNVTLDGSRSTDTNGTITKYEWFEGANFLGSGPTLTKNDFSIGDHNVTLKVTDNNGAVDTDTTLITVTPRSNISIITDPVNGATNVERDKNITITFSGSMDSSTFGDGNITLKKGNTTISSSLQTQSNNIVTLVPTNLLEFNTVYTLTLLSNIQDTSGGHIAKTIVNFTIKNQRFSRILQTGQIKSYDQVGNEVADDSIKDDGYYARQGLGRVRNYTRREINATAGFVQDNITGLMWQDEEYTEDEATAYNDANESGKVLYWANAVSYCTTSHYGGYDDWRLPNIDELETIVNYGRTRNIPAGSLGNINPIFQYVGQAQTSSYWSLTTLPSSNTGFKAWHTFFHYGDSHWVGNNTNIAFYVRCVRAGQ